MKLKIIVSLLLFFNLSFLYAETSEAKKNLEQGKIYEDNGDLLAAKNAYKAGMAIDSENSDLKKSLEKIEYKILGEDLLKKAQSSKSSQISFIYYIGAYDLYSKQKEAKDAYKKIESDLEKELCLKMYLSVSSKTTTKLPQDLLALIEQNFKKQIESFNKKKCISFVDSKINAQTNIQINILDNKYTSEEKNIPKKVQYNTSFKSVANPEYIKVFSVLESSMSEISAQYSMYADYANIFKERIKTRDEYEQLKDKLDDYKDLKKDLDKVKDKKKENEYILNYDEEILKQTDARVTELKNKLKELKEKEKIAWQSIDSDKKDAFKKQQYNIEDLDVKLERIPYFILESIKSESDYVEVNTKVNANLALEITITDSQINKTFLQTKESEDFFIDNIFIPKIQVITNATNKVLVKESGKIKILTEYDVKLYLIDKTIKKIIEKTKESDLKYYGDRYYTLFKNSKTLEDKTINAVKTFIVEDYLSNKKEQIKEVKEYIKDNYKVDIDDKEYIKK